MRTPPPLLSATLDSPLGRLLAGVISDEVVFLYFAEVEGQKPLGEVIHARFKQQPVLGESPVFLKLKNELDAYFHGTLKCFSSFLHPTGTPFELSVWSELQQIPYGTTVTYKTIAQRLGTPTKTRPVGQAIGRNPLSILIPCHRIVGSNGKLTGYSGGLDRKHHLLTIEQGL